MPESGRRRPAWRRIARAALPRVGRGLLTAIVTCLPVAVLAGFAQLRSEPLQDLDESIIRAATDVTRDHPLLFDALIIWQEVFQPWRVYVVLIPAAIWAWRAGLRCRTIWGVSTALVGWNLGLDLKLLVQRARPVAEDPISQAPGYSFPSGHVSNVTMAMACVLVMVWPLLRRRPPALRAGLVALAATVTILTALDRIFLGVHYPSDTIAGALFAAALTTVSWLGYRRTPRSRRLPRAPGHVSTGAGRPGAGSPRHLTHPPRPGGRR